MEVQSVGHAPSPIEYQAPAPGGPEETEPNTISPELWHEYLSLYLLISRQRGEDLSILDLDINSLKAANDELGHQAGDQLIDLVHQVADDIPKQLRTHENGTGRPADVVASSPHQSLNTSLPDNTQLPGPQSFRVGGDEFRILLPNTNYDEALVVADRLEKTTVKKLEEPERQPLEKLGAGVAIGVYTFKPGDTASEGMRAADTAMYEHKISQARPLSPEEEVDFWIAIRHLERAGVRQRDVPKYVEKLGASAIAQAFKNQPNPGQLTFDLPGGTDQES
ncbi:MAG TPA: GGDEF domain-containing protein [Candidatus Saccharimonadales bacterium]|nr:GGDEF domain-containing protein [Candidatus Saccharimonadales bacterium]